jgi:hypothetical protein
LKNGPQHYTDQASVQGGCYEFTGLIAKIEQRLLVNENGEDEKIAEQSCQIWQAKQSVRCPRSSQPAHQRNALQGRHTIKSFNSNLVNINDFCTLYLAAIKIPINIKSATDEVELST